MKKTKCNEVCVYCGSDNVIFYGKQNNKQRYKCKDCGTIFTENPEFTCERSPKRAMTVLLNLLNNHSYNAKDLSKAFNKMKNDDICKNVNKIRIDTKYVTKKYESSIPFTIDCYNPRLLICADDDVITFYPLPAAIYNKNINNANNNDDSIYDEFGYIIPNSSTNIKSNQNCRKITINDTGSCKGLKSNLQQTYINRG